MNSEYYLQRHEYFLEQILNNLTIPAPLIHSAMNYSLFPGGKRIRPLLIYLAGDILKIDHNTLDVLAASVELTHCYSLIHDDLPAMDNDDLRRGKPSCHKTYDEATAILVGDGMQALAIEILLSNLPSLLNAAQIVAITKALVHASGVNGMVSGQSLDLSELTKPNLSEQQVQEIHLLKTGKLILACFEMVLAAQATVSEPIKQAFRAYAYHIGLVFQMQDDYLDHYAPRHTLGKNRSSDGANAKNTYATLFSRSVLEEKINQHYALALNALALFGEQGEELKKLSLQLQQRSHLTS
jgi:farnesyl diphosphate synthase